MPAWCSAAAYRCQAQLQGLNQLLLKHKLNAPSTVAHQLTNTRQGHLQAVWLNPMHMAAT